MMTNEEYLKQLFKYIHIAKNTSMKELCLRGDYKNNPNIRYPSTIGEDLASTISSLLISRDFDLTTDEGQRLDEMTSISSALDTSNNNQEDWLDLFRLVDEFERKYTQ